jgi:flagellum-specific peptidoglycan hydrolase FlgJ
MTGFSLIPGSTAAELASPTNAHIRLLAQQQAAQPASSAEAPLRTAIVNVAHYYLRMAQSKSPAEMEALIWQRDSIDGVDHGPSCAAFASLTLEQAAQVVGQQSWVTGGSSYPWPLHPWVDARVDPNPASLGVTSILQDAQAHHRWHPVGDGYRPLPGDWVLFDGHVEVVTGYSGGVLHTIGGDSLPDFSVNAHEYPDPLSAQGVAGFVNNGALAGRASTPARNHAHVTAAGSAGHHHHPAPGQAAIPGLPAIEPGGHTFDRASHGAAVSAVRTAGGSAAAAKAAGHPPGGSEREHATDRPGAARQGTLDDAAAPDVPGTGVSGLVATLQAARRGAASIPGIVTSAHHRSGRAALSPGTHYRRHQPPAATPSIAASRGQQAFIMAVAQGALATQRKYGVPAAVTIAQAIDESGWGQSYLASKDHNLFGIKGSGPAGSDMQPTQEVVNGQSVSQIASFRVYHSIAQSIEDHGRLLAGGAPYQQSMTLTHDPNAFASSLTGVYATDPSYGAKLISLMQRYNLYRYDHAASAAESRATRPAGPPQTATAHTPASAADIPGAPAPAAKPPRSRATRTPPPTSPAPASPSPGSPVPTSPVLTSPPASPAPTSPPASPAPTSPGPGSLVPTSPGVTSPGRQSPAPTRPRPSVKSPAKAAPTPPRTQAGAPAPASPAKARAKAAAPPGTAQTPDIPGVTQIPAPPAAGASASAGSRALAPTRRARVSPHRSAPSTSPATQAWSARRMSGSGRHHARTLTAHTTVLVANRYQTHMPASVKSDFTTVARAPLTQSEPLYRDIADDAGIGWQLLAACDWMQCQSQPRLSPVHGERLGTVNADGTSYQTKSGSLEQCAHDLVQLARAVYQIDLIGHRHLSVRELANVFAAFRWGALLKTHHISAMEFPYSVAGLTVQHTNMRWPKIAERNAPDKPGSRFRMTLGAVPVMLSLNYPATV